MKFGARFLWDLDHKWLSKAPADPHNLLVIAGYPRKAGQLGVGQVR
jgi:hypothetical protein